MIARNFVIEVRDRIAPGTYESGMRFGFLAIALAACGTTPDERPPTLEVITLEVLAPTCGQVQCHSTTTREQGYALETVEAARYSLTHGLLDVQPNGKLELFDVIESDDAERRMPADSPLNDADIVLLHKWFDNGAEGL